MEIVQSSDSGNGLAISGCGFVFFVVRSDRNPVSSDVRRRTLEVLHTAVDLLPQRCVRRPSSWSQVLVTLTVLQEVFHYMYPKDMQRVLLCRIYQTMDKRVINICRSTYTEL